MTIVTRFLLALSSLVVLQPERIQRTSNCLRYEPQVVSLKGRLNSATRYGLPNFGETPKQDEKIRVPILRLDRAVNVCADTTSDVNVDNVRHVREMQLIFPEGDAKSWYKRRVRVHGTLMLGHTGQHYTKIVMTVQDIESVN